MNCTPPSFKQQLSQLTIRAQTAHARHLELKAHRESLLDQKSALLMDQALCHMERQAILQDELDRATPSEASQASRQPALPDPQSEDRA